MRQFSKKALVVSMMSFGMIASTYANTYTNTYTNSYVAEIASVTASTEGENVASNVIDSSLSTRWSSIGEQWLQFELVEMSVITAIDIAFYKGNKRHAYFEVQSSVNGADWNSLFIGESSGENRKLESIDISEAEGKYIRILCFGNSKNLWNTITEVEITSTPLGDSRLSTSIESVEPSSVNVSSISTNADDGNEAQNVMDDNLFTRWSAQGANQWLQFELLEQTIITDIDIAFYKGNRRTAYFELQASMDGDNWDVVFNGASSGESISLESFDLTNTNSKYIRFIGNGNNANMWNSVTEVVINSAEEGAESTDPVDTDPSDLWLPTPSSNLTWDWRIGDTPNPDSSTYYDVYDIDLFDNSATDIAAFQARGITVICYFSAGTYEGWRDDWQEYFSFINTDSYSGNEAPFAGKMDDWDERWLDVREIDLLEPIMRGRMAMAKAKGCDAVEPDNMDSYTNQSEVEPDGSLTATHQLAYNKAIAEWAHDAGLSVGLKNDVDQIDELVDYFDWALNEQCYQYDECDGYQAFIKQNKAVFGVEYSGSTSTICKNAEADGYFWLKKKLALTEYREGCEDY